MAASEGQKKFEQHIAEMIWWYMEQKRSPLQNSKQKKSRDGEGKVSYFGVSYAKRRAARDRPPPSLAKKKKKKVRFQKKINLPKAKPISAKKNC